MTTGSELWAWIGTNHTQITALCSMVGAGVAVTGLLVAIFRKASRDEEKWREHFRRHPEDLGPR